MTWESVLIAGGGLTFFLGLIGAGIKWLISDYYNKAQTLEELKAKHITDMLDSFSNDIDNIGKIARAVRNEMVETRNCLTKHQTSLASVSVDIGTLAKVVKAGLDTSELVAESLSDEIESRVKIRLAKLQERLNILSEKNGVGFD